MVLDLGLIGFRVLGGISFVGDLHSRHEGGKRSQWSCAIRLF